MKTKKNILITIFSLIFFGVVYFSFINKNEKSTLSKNINTKKKLSHKTIQRSIASVKPQLVKQKNKKKTLPSKAKDWKVKAISQLRKVWDSEFTVERKSSKKYKKHGRVLDVEHIIVRLVSKEGLPSSFEAYIDSHTGRILQSWNKTRYELNKPLSFSTEGLSFTSIPVNKK